MERKLLLVFALTFLVIMLFQPLLKKYGPQPAAPAKTENAAEQGNPTLPQSTRKDGVAEPAQVPASLGRETGQSPVTTQASAPQEATSEAETVIENDVYRIVFTNRGGRVKSWVLKKYTDDKGGQLELVNSGAAEKYGYPLQLWLYDEGLRNKVNSALYVAVPSSQFSVLSSREQSSSSGADRGRTGTSAAPQPIKFDYSDGDVAVEKTFTFDASTYVVGVKTAVYVKGAQVTAFPMWPAGFGGDITAPQYAQGQILYQYDSNVERLAIKKVGGSATVHGPLNWAGVSAQYFAAVFLPQDAQNAAMVTLHNTIEIPHGRSEE